MKFSEGHMLERGKKEISTFYMLGLWSYREIKEIYREIKKFVRN